MTTAEHTRWGPFVPSLSPTDLLCRLQVLRAFCQVYTPDPSNVCIALWRAENGDLGQVEVALREFDRLPALTIRRILCSYAEHWRGPNPIKPKVDVDAAL
jgi:hypothetical protein